VTVWVVVCLAVIIGIVALGMDGGRMMEERRHAQAAADAAALAAASDLYFNWWQNQGTDPAGSAQAAALASAAANGYANDGTTSAVTVNIPPTSGAFAGQAEYVEVIVQSRLQASFSAVFTAGPLPVQARAVARGRPKKIGLLLLQSSGINALVLTGGAAVDVVNAPVVIDGGDPLAADIVGTGTISADSFDLAGALPLLGQGNMHGPIHPDVPPTPDPLRSLAPPDQAGAPVRAILPTAILSGCVTLQPGVYRGGIVIGANAAVTFAPGTYVLDGGGLVVSGAATVTGDQVLIDNTGGLLAGPVAIATTGRVSLTPPTEGPYTGISLYQDRGAILPVTISGNADFQLTGTVYAPTATVVLTAVGTAGNTVGGAYIAAAVQVLGTDSVRIDQGSNRLRVPEIGLVE
jgi:hypothetical protein